MKRWTMKQLRELDDITFAMCILSERRELLNQNAPLAQKIKKAYHTLDSIRGGCPIKFGTNGWPSVRELIYREVDKEYKLEDIRSKIENKSMSLDLSGLLPEVILADKGIMEQIYYRFEKCGFGDGYWDDIDYSIEQGIKDILESRRGDDGDAV